MKQLMDEMRGFRNEVNGRFNEMNGRFDDVDNRFIQVNERFNEVDNRFTEVNERFNEVDNRFNKVDIQFNEVNGRLTRLEKGQEEIIEVFKHNATLMIENFTDIRKDLRTKHIDVQADVDLLFKEVEGLKRQTHKIEQRIGN